jgi:hypothetical protein
VADKKEQVLSGGFAMVACEPTEATAGARGRYNRLVEDFVNHFNPGDCIVVEHPNGKVLSEDESKTMYAGIQQYLRYQRIKRNNRVPARVHRNSKENKLYLERLGE